MCDLARDMNPAMRVVEKRNISLMHLVTRVHWENNRRVRNACT